ncbi:nif-specific transcriptional activator NifA [Aromatoleum evansii]|uniref:Nif-specific regulatory protein n=1 Tax=Aromatoleum evansii TaxID=59406 RepID=A0ABZ1AN64_AROEV|nr:nif-specific transcriptional activator NifA [Aromatoleum evansii]NMG30827.1 nif-specific transcriptional activator NifA [Aromatoleum evansii]WRL47213.1 nif-specific transcriptional activator NifA [Aromatoleum evansii]
MTHSGNYRRTSDIDLLTIYEISKVLTSSLDFRQCVHSVLRLLLTQLHMRHALVGLVQADEQLHILGAAGVPWPMSEAPVLDPGVGVISKVLRSGSPIVIPDIAADANFTNRTGRDPQQLARVSYVVVPLKLDREVIGILSADRHPDAEQPVNFERDVRILSLVANLLAQTYRLQQSVAADRQVLIEESARLQKQLQGSYDIENVVGRSKRMKEVFADVHQAAPSGATVLLRGESGTGKEAIAHAIHYLSPRAKGPFVKLNCAALPETLLESELFGHEKGAFTGATSERKGRFELAKGGTIFLDEIGDISPAFQAKLLRVLQEQEFERVGGNKTLRADVRLVAATNRNLEEMVQKNEFRADLYFRLNVVTIFMPSLRERKDDIPLLVDFFLDRFNRENRRQLTITPGALEILMRCNWPGNVRELENCIQRAATMTRSNTIREVDMRCQKGQCFSAVLLESAQSRACFPVIGMPARSTPPARAMPAAPAGDAGDDIAAGRAPTSERERLVDAMERCGWVQAKAARMLGLTPRQIGYALRKYNVEVKQL